MSVWRDRPVLVTGATGLLGGWLVEALVGHRADVVCLVRDRPPRSRFYLERMEHRVTVVRGEVTDLALLERTLAEYDIRTVFHLAAQTIVGTARRAPAASFETNIRGTWCVLDACRTSKPVPEVLVASSDKAYGAQALLPYQEDAPLRGRAPYDVSKSCADLIAQSYGAFYGVPVCVTRCGNFFGGGDLNWSRLVPGVLRDLLAGRRPVIRSDGSLVRDYLYVEDGVSAYLRAAEALMERPELAGRAFNFSSEQPMTVMEMLGPIGDALGVRVDPIVLGEAHDEIPAQYLDSSAARDELGWSPKTGLVEGLRRTAEWYRTYLGGIR